MSDEKRDNWAHRSAGMKCQTCMWFVLKDAQCRHCGVVWGQQHKDGCPGVSNGLKPVGRCRRRAPTLNGWPAVFGTDWCGDHKLDETKL